MSKVVFKSPYAKTGKSVGGNYTSYIAKRDRVDKSINAKKVEINLRYIATRPRVEKVGEHGLFGQDDNINLQKASADIRNHNGIVCMPIISLTREDADRLGYNNAESWRTLLRSKQFEIADAYHIPVNDLVWYAAFHDESYHPHIHMIVYNKNPGSEYLSKKACNDMREMLTKIIFKDDLKQIYDERLSLRDQIIDEVYEKINDFQMDIDEASEEFVSSLNELKFELAGYKGKKNYRFISPKQKEKVDKLVQVVCQDNNLQALYNEWCRLQLALQRYYSKEPKECFDTLENNENFKKRLQNAVLKSVLKDNMQENIYTNTFDTSPIYSDIVFNLCKMIEHSTEQTIEEGFTKSIVDSREREKEFKRNQALGIHMGGM